MRKINNQNVSKVWNGRKRTETTCKKCGNKYLTVNPKQTIYCPNCRKARYVKDKITGEYIKIKVRRQNADYYFKSIRFFVKNLARYEDKKVFAVFNKGRVCIMVKE